MNIDHDILKKEDRPDNLAIADKWIISRCNTKIQEITDNLEKYELGLAAKSSMTLFG